MRRTTLESYRERILRVLSHIERHLDEELSLDDLARVACFSPCHFHRIFRGLVGEPVKEHVRRLRLERAAWRLRFKNQPVTGIAFDAGYEAHEAFTRSFRARYGESPSAFREQRRAAIAEGGGAGVRVVELPARRFLCLRHVGPYDAVGSTWSKLIRWAIRRRLYQPDTPCHGIVYDDPEITPPERLRYDAAIPIDGDAEPGDAVEIRDVAAGEYAAIEHHGGYDRIFETYARLCGEWLPSSGRELAEAPSIEWYKNLPGTTPVDQLRTEVFLRLE